MQMCATLGLFQSLMVIDPSVYVMELRPCGSFYVENHYSPGNRGPISSMSLYFWSSNHYHGIWSVQFLKIDDVIELSVYEY